MIPLLPYKYLVFETRLSKEEIIRRLRVEVSNRRLALRLFERRTQKFEGEVSETGFKISRIIRYRNSFLPIVQGQFFPFARGVRIEVRMRLHIAILFFSIFFLLFVGTPAIVAISRIIFTGRFAIGMFLPLGMLLSYYLLVMISFDTEANKASKLLYDIFEANNGIIQKS